MEQRRTSAELPPQQSIHFARIASPRLCLVKPPASRSACVNSLGSAPMLPPSGCFVLRGCATVTIRYDPRNLQHRMQQVEAQYP